MQQASAGQPQSSDTLLSVAREVIPNLWKITVPIPFPLRTANMHALVGTDGWALIDTGMGTPDARAAFKESLQLAGLSIDKLRTIVLTHHHPDHVGLSGELQAESGATVYMHPIDEVSLQVIWSGTMPRRFERVSRFFQQHRTLNIYALKGELSSVIQKTESFFTQLYDKKTMSGRLACKAIFLPTR